MKYVKEKWATFDRVVVGWTESRASNSRNKSTLCRHDNLDTKDVPVIILCNKVDDPDDERRLDSLQKLA
jgi:hypothetical protein